MSTRAAIKIAAVLILTFLFATCGDDPHAVLFIDIVPATQAIAVGQTMQFEAWAQREHQFQETDVTGAARWESTNTSVATIDATGLATGVGCGVTNIKAVYASVVGQATLSVC